MDEISHLKSDLKALKTRVILDVNKSRNHHTQNEKNALVDEIVSNNKSNIIKESNSPISIKASIESFNPSIQNIMY